jgi:hypothetical protein
MDNTAAAEINKRLPGSARVVDIGGGASPFARADYVVDAIPFCDRAKLGTQDLGITPRYSKNTWIQVDLCDHRPWPIEDKQFDFATCSHLLEDVRDPIWVCSELSRVAKAGYIEVPSRVIEQSLGVEHPSYAGYHHHRWLVSIKDDCLEFRHKPHILHSTRRAIVTKVGVGAQINSKYSIIQLWWTDSIKCSEILEFSEERVVDELCKFAEESRRLADLLIPRRLSMKTSIRKRVYSLRRRLGHR